MSTQGHCSVRLVVFLAAFEVTDVLANIIKWRLAFLKNTIAKQLL
jgi:hypothetical protein